MKGILGHTMSTNKTRNIDSFDFKRDSLIHWTDLNECVITVLEEVFHQKIRFKRGFMFPDVSQFSDCSVKIKRTNIIDFHFQSILTFILSY